MIEYMLTRQLHPEDLSLHFEGGWLWPSQYLQGNARCHRTISCRKEEAGEHDCWQGAYI